MIITFIPALLFVPSLQVIIPLLMLLWFGCLYGIKLMFN